MKMARKYSLAVICFLITAFFAVGCSKANESNESTENVSIESAETENVYRPFNENDFLDVIPSILMLYDGDSSNNIDLSENMRTRYYTGVIDEFASSRDSSEQQISALIKYILADIICADSSAVEIDFIDYVQPSETTYAYCKVNVLSENKIDNVLYEDWKIEDEIYMMVGYSLGTVSSGKDAVKITCFIRNFTETGTKQTDTGLSDGEVLQTQYYSIKIPSDWKDKYYYRVIWNDSLDGAYNCDLFMYSENEVGEALLFSIQMYEPNDPYAVEAELYYGLHDIYWIETTDGKVFDVAWEYSGDRQCTDEEADSYFSMVDVIPQIMETFQLNEGCKKAAQNEELETNDNVNTDDVPYVDISSSGLGMNYSQLLIQNDMYANDYPRDAMSRYGMQYDDDIDYKAVDDGFTTYYVGVKNDTIVSILQEGYSEYFRDIIAYDGPLTEVSPKRVNAPNGERLLIWKLNNGYLIVDTYPSATTDLTGSYLDNIVNWYTFLTDPSTNEWMEWSAVPNGF